MKKLLFLLIYISTIVSCSQNKYPKEISSNELTSHPQKYVGEMIIVKGFFRVDDINGHYLFHSKPYKLGNEVTVSFYLEEDTASEEAKVEFINPSNFEHAVLVVGEVRYDSEARKIYIVNIRKMKKKFLNGEDYYFDMKG